MTYFVQTEAERYPNGMPHAFIAAQLKQLGLDTYTHNFSLQYPLGENKASLTVLHTFFKFHF